jgi:hypothetical protein
MAGLNFPDRVTMSILGEEMFPNGEIYTWSGDSSFNQNLVNGFSKNFRASGTVSGNANFTFSISVNYSPDSKVPDFELLLNRANNIPVTFSPFDPNHQQSGTVWTYTDVKVQNIGKAAPGQGQQITQTISFIAVDFLES